MPSFTIHGIVPLLLLLAIRRLDARKVWILWPLTFLPDIDYLLPGLHRAVTGNIFMLAPAAIGLAYAYRPQHKRPELAEWMTIALIYLGSHLVMDIFTGGTVLFYPLSEYTVCYLAYINVVTATNTLQPVFEACSHDGIPRVAEVYPWLSVPEGAMLAFLLPMGMAMGAMSLWGYIRERRRTVVTLK